MKKFFLSISLLCIVLTNTIQGQSSRAGERTIGTSSTFPYAVAVLPRQYQDFAIALYNGLDNYKNAVISANIGVYSATSILDASNPVTGSIFGLSLTRDQLSSIKPLVTENDNFINIDQALVRYSGNWVPGKLALINDVKNAIKTTENYSNFIEQLRVIVSKFVRGDYSITSQAEIEGLSYWFASIEASAKYLSISGEEEDNLNPQIKVKCNWWCRWGKCAAGILGGAGLGALDGAAAGSILPGLGTVAGGIIGGIAGGLVGGAAAC